MLWTSQLRPRCLALALLPACAAPEPLPATGALSTEAFTSTLVGDDYLLRVRLPPDYDPEARYPLVVQLDPTFVGLEQYAITVGLVSDYAARGEWDEAIVVGVDYPDDPGLRQRDYLPPDPPEPSFGAKGADRFYAMLRDELLPHLELSYAVDPERRYLLGHSNGGVFAWYAALRHDPERGLPLFAGVVAADNGYSEALFTYERWHAERAEDLPMIMYATRATYNGAPQEIGFEAMIERLEQRSYPNLVLESEALETDHGGAIWPSYEAGLDMLLGARP